MLKLTAISILLVLLPHLTHAQLLEETDHPVIVKKNPLVVEEDSSEFNRIGKKYEIALMPIAAGPLPSFNTGINFSTYLTRNASIILSYSQTIPTLACSGGIECNPVGSTYEVYYRQFFGNSFYIAGGLDQRHISYHYVDHFMNSHVDFDGDSTAVGFVIGNQWQWQSFNIGCDWIGIIVPFAYSVTNVSENSEPTILEQEKKYWVTGTNPMAVRFHLGMAF